VLAPERFDRIELDDEDALLQLAPAGEVRGVVDDSTRRSLVESTYWTALR
jgi:hypothetical protein